MNQPYSETSTLGSLTPWRGCHDDGWLAGPFTSKVTLPRIQDTRVVKVHYLAAVWKRYKNRRRTSTGGIKPTEKVLSVDHKKGGNTRHYGTEGFEEGSQLGPYRPSLRDSRLSAG